MHSLNIRIQLIMFIEMYKTIIEKSKNKQKNKTKQKKKKKERKV